MMNPQSSKPTDPATDEDYEVEMVDARPGAVNDDVETENIEKEGDPIGDNFA
jgi:hypothetical protein